MKKNYIPKRLLLAIAAGKTTGGFTLDPGLNPDVNPPKIKTLSP